VVFALFIDAGRAKEIDPTFELAEVIESFDVNNHNCLVREAYGGFWPVSGRDFVLFRHLRCRDDGTLLVCAKSVASPACPPTGGYVRGEVVLNALVLQPLGNTVLVGESRSPPPKTFLRRCGAIRRRQWWWWWWWWWWWGMSIGV